MGYKYDIKFLIILNHQSEVGGEMRHSIVKAVIPSIG